MYTMYKKRSDSTLDKIFLRFKKVSLSVFFWHIVATYWSCEAEQSCSSHETFPWKTTNTAQSLACSVQFEGLFNFIISSVANRLLWTQRHSPSLSEKNWWSWDIAQVFNLTSIILCSIDLFPLIKSTPSRHEIVWKEKEFRTF